jgi:hypothetical protein
MISGEAGRLHALGLDRLLVARSLRGHCFSQLAQSALEFAVEFIEGVVCGAFPVDNFLDHLALVLGSASSVLPVSASIASATAFPTASAIASSSASTCVASELSSASSVSRGLTGVGRGARVFGG